MSANLWLYSPARCDGDFCPKDCDNCEKGAERDDLISRAEAIDAMKKLYDADLEAYGCEIPEMFDCDRAIEALNELPSAQPEMAKRIVGKSRDGMTLWYQCDMCNEPVDVLDSFCRSCGRRLEDG